MPSVEVSHISKSYADKAAVDDLSFTVEAGEVFGLIGPNGAGKTTTIRMMMDIIKPDSGAITILGEKLSEATKNRLGYMPEERGLYRKQRVMDSITYLASLKGVDARTARERAEALLAKTGMLAARTKRTEELSKGMGQLIQLIVTILHEPDLVILDEPFSGLDPVNTELMKNTFLELRDRGKSLIFSTHQMSQVEELCDRVLMIAHGRAVLYGNLREIKTRYRSHAVIVEADGALPELDGVLERHENRGETELVLDSRTTPQQMLERLVSAGVAVNRFEVATPSLNEIFLEVAGHKNE